MPSQGETQKSAGIDLTKPAKKKGTRYMVSKDMTIVSNLQIDNCEYKGNAVLNANK